ncbi:MAG: glycerophosphodiester phosphodiesterase [Clostridiales bacterium]|jgi:glycerophosphoryl diester phosphodiesterase|nr:glycerophosphodiester phosphodiesterase [Clostridiales bacterium]
MENDKDIIRGADWLYARRIAHRGLHNDLYPENSLPAFQNAIDNGYNIETDLYILKDGKIAVFHDLNTARMCGVDSKISDLTSSDLKNYKLKGTENTIPLLEDLLALVNGKAGLLLELKSLTFNGKLESALFEILKDYKGDYAVQSFNPMSVSWFKRHAPDVYRGQLAAYYEGTRRLEKALISALSALKFRKLNKPDFIAYNISNLPNKYVDMAKHEGKKLLAWTVKTDEERKTAEEICDNYIFEGFLPG